MSAAVGEPPYALQVTRSEEPYIELFAEEQQRLVYLTADAETELGELDPQVCTFGYTDS